MHNRRSWGILLGVSMGNAVSYFLGSGLSVPYMWILIALVMCVLVGVVSGYYPAVKASKLDPIEASDMSN